MDKTEFTTELKELMSTMSEEEIEKTINTLWGCKNAITRKVNKEKGEKARLLSTIECVEAELTFVGNRKKTGRIKTLGASLLTVFDFDCLFGVLPGVNGKWWLYDKEYAWNRNRAWHYYSDSTASIRPVVVIDGIDGKLKEQEDFYINNEKFTLLTPSLMIRTNCLCDSCTFNADSYENSILKNCVDGWYMKLIRENCKSATKTVHKK